MIIQDEKVSDIELVPHEDFFHQRYVWDGVRVRHVYSVADHREHQDEQWQQRSQKNYNNSLTGILKRLEIFPAFVIIAVLFILGKCLLLIMIYFSL